MPLIAIGKTFSLFLVGTRDVQISRAPDMNQSELGLKHGQNPARLYGRSQDVIMIDLGQTQSFHTLKPRNLDQVDLNGSDLTRLHRTDNPLNANHINQSIPTTRTACHVSSPANMTRHQSATLVAHWQMTCRNTHPIATSIVMWSIPHQHQE